MEVVRVFVSLLSMHDLFFYFFLFLGGLELDPHGADGNGNPIGGLVYGNSFGSQVNVPTFFLYGIAAHLIRIVTIPRSVHPSFSPSNAPN